MEMYLILYNAFFFGCKFNDTKLCYDDKIITFYFRMIFVRTCIWRTYGRRYGLCNKTISIIQKRFYMRPNRNVLSLHNRGFFKMYFQKKGILINNYVYLKKTSNIINK